MKNLKEVILKGEPDKAFEYEGKLYRVRIKSARQPGTSVFIITVAALNDDKSVHETASGWTITEPHVLSFRDCTKSELTDNIESVVLDKIQECERYIENQNRVEKYMKNWVKE